MTRSSKSPVITATATYYCAYHYSMASLAYEDISVLYLVGEVEKKNALHTLALCFAEILAKKETLITIKFSNGTSMQINFGTFSSMSLKNCQQHVLRTTLET